MSDLEKIIIACIMQKPKLMSELVVSEEHFKNDICKIVIRLFKLQYSKIKTIDLTLLNFAELKINDNQKKQIVTFLIETMQNELVIIGNFYHYQEELFKNYISEKILIEVNNFQNKKITQEMLLDNIHKLENEHLITNNARLNSDEIYRKITEKGKNINFRFTRLSKACNIHEHDLVILSARPGIGKTAFALNLIEDLSSEYKCLYFNMEMSENQVFQRLVSINTGIPMKCYTDIQTDYQNQKIIEGCKTIAEKKIYCYSGTQTVKSIKHQIIQESKNEHVIAFVDYVGLVVGQSKLNSYERITEIVKELRQVSLDYNCTIFLVAQINRNSENTKDKRPKISDLKETGELEQSGTTVIMLHNENYYANINSEVDTIQVIIGKNRNGKTGVCELKYDKENQRFDNK